MLQVPVSTIYQWSYRGEGPRSIRLGPMVTAQSYRNPALLAKMAAGLDVMSGGRLEFGLGAGWDDGELRAYGFDFPAARERVDRLAEAVQVVKAMWAEPDASFDGRYYRLTDDGAPHSIRVVLG